MKVKELWLHPRRVPVDVDNEELVWVKTLTNQYGTPYGISVFLEEPVWRQRLETDMEPMLLKVEHHDHDCDCGGCSDTEPVGYDLWDQIRWIRPKEGLTMDPEKAWPGYRHSDHDMTLEDNEYGITEAMPAYKTGWTKI